MNSPEKQTVLSRADRVENVLEELLKTKLEPGCLIEISRLESLLGVQRDTPAFSYMVSEIRHCLFGKGKYLSGEGSTAKGAYEILHERDNHWIARLVMARTDRAYEGMHTLMTQTDRTKLSKLEQDRHDNALREITLRMRISRIMPQTMQSLPDEASTDEPNEAEPLA
jgi:hypothetical protein